MIALLREWFEVLATKIKTALELLGAPYDHYPDIGDRKDREPDITLPRGPFF